jgi:hypothetical protein
MLYQDPGFGRDRFGGLAQLGERLLCKQEVIGSIPLASTKTLLGLGVEVWASIDPRRSFRSAQFRAPHSVGVLGVGRSVPLFAWSERGCCDLS